MILLNMEEKIYRITNHGLKNSNIDLIAPDEEFQRVSKQWNRYYISNHGRLIRKNAKNEYKLVNPSLTKGGYLTYVLTKPARKYRGKKVRDENGNIKALQKCHTAQKLVAQIFVINPYPVEYQLTDLQVHHKNGKRTDNYYKNLMYLCKNKNGRKDHDFIHSIKKHALYNEETMQFHAYRDIDVLLKRLNVDILEFIDSIRFGKTIKSPDGKWDMYCVNSQYVGIQWKHK